MKRYIKSALAPAAALLISLASTSCLNDLDKEPISPKIDLEVSNDGLFNKCYANFGISGNGSGENSDDDPDVKGFDDPGMTGLVRAMWNINELPTDEATCSWGDGLQELNSATYDPSHPWVKLYYTRLTLGITTCNQYLQMAGSDDVTRTAEVRFLRAMQYFLLMDTYGNVPFTETLEKPTQKSRQEMYEWLVGELKAIEPNLMDAQPKKSTDANYGRIDKAACWLLLSRLYLNAEVYTGTAHWQEAKDYAEKVIKSRYRLNTTGSSNGKWSAYQMVFMGDNMETSAANDGKITDADRQYCGSATPKYTFSFSAGFTWKDLTFSAMLQGVAGAKAMNVAKFMTLSDVEGNFNRDSRILDAWSETNRDSDIPRLSKNDPNGNFSTPSDWYLENASYLRLKNVTVSYDLTNLIRKSAHLNSRNSRLSVYVSGENLCTITNYTGIDPECGGWDAMKYPVARTFSFGVKLTY